MSVFLCARGLFGIIDGTLLGELSEDLEEWNDKDVTCLSIMILSINPKLMGRLMTCRTTKEMWCRLCIVHEYARVECYREHPAFATIIF